MATRDRPVIRDRAAVRRGMTLKLNERELSLIRRGAALDGRTPCEFIRESARARAEALLETAKGTAP